MTTTNNAVETYLERFEDLGLAGFLDEFRTPVLIGSSSQAPQGGWGFHTTHGRAADIVRTLPRTPSGTSNDLVNQVFEIRKRSEGLFPGQIGVGRARNVDVVIPSPRVSKYHAYFLQEDDRFLVADAGSANGTKVDGEPLEPRVARALGESATLIFGGLPFLYFSPRGFAVFLEHQLDED